METTLSKSCHGFLDGGAWYDTNTCTHLDDIRKREFTLADKPSNPKDIIGSTKLPLNLVPKTTMAYLTLGHLEGQLKYGTNNWREAGVRMSIYLDALQRHLAKMSDGGEWEDPVTKVPHLANAITCLSIIIDAYECGKLTDDRPKSCVGLPDLIDKFSEKVKHLQGLFADKKPIDYLVSGPKERE